MSQRNEIEGWFANGADGAIVTTQELSDDLNIRMASVSAVLSTLVRESAQGGKSQRSTPGVYGLDSDKGRVYTWAPDVTTAKQRAKAEGMTLFVPPKKKRPAPADESIWPVIELPPGEELSLEPPLELEELSLEPPAPLELEEGIDIPLMTMQVYADHVRISKTDALDVLDALVQS